MADSGFFFFFLHKNPAQHHTVFLLDGRPALLPACCGMDDSAGAMLRTVTTEKNQPHKCRLMTPSGI